MGWQWVFVATGLPARAAGPLCAVASAERSGRSALADAGTEGLGPRTLQDEADASPDPGHASPCRAMPDRRVLLLAVMYVGFPLAAYGLSYWLPTVVKGFGDRTPSTAC